MTDRCEPPIAEYIDYNPATGQFYWKTRPDWRVSDITRRTGQRAGWMDEAGYIRIELAGITYKAHRLAWFIQTGEWPASIIDHINGDKGDNSWGNLRLSTNSQNQMNRGKARHNTSGHKGVSFDKSSRKWRGSITVNGRQRHLGLFNTAEAAGAAYAKACHAEHGDFANV